MKSRVAFIATLAMSLALIVLLILSSVSLIRERNEDLYTELETACVLIKGSMPSGEDSEAFTALAQYLSNMDMTLGIYHSVGEAISPIDGRPLVFDEMDVYQASKGASSIYTATDANGGSLLCAADVLRDGSFIKVTHAPIRFIDIFTSEKSLMLICVFIVLSAGFDMALVIINQRRSRAIQQVMNALDSFSDGRFDARLSVKDGFSRDLVAEYNSILSRIDERIFNQRSRNQALSVVMNQIQNGIIAVDDKLRVMIVTPVAKRLLGVTGNPNGMHINDASQDVRLDQVFSDAMHHDGVYTNEVAARTAAGRGRRPLRLYVSPMRKDGRVVGALALVEDITELKRLEQVRTDFAANVSHELKTPLTSIRGFVETLLDGAIDNPEMARKFLNIIMLESERLTRLINDILSISKLESGMDEAPKERLRLEKEAHDVTEMLEIHAKEKQVTLNCHMNKTPIYILGNKDHVEQMLINLIENGIKYNKPGGSVTVQVFANETSANISVSDTGIGIAEEHLPRMFERFYRVDKGRSRSMGGTGLGLAIVKHIVRTMQGEIEVHSKLGEGTEFLVTIPLAPKPTGEEITEEDIRQEDFE